MPSGTDARAIGVFDSGVGGLTVLSEIRRRLPGEVTIYLGDNARAPYGPRPADEVRRFTAECVSWLLAQDVKLLVLACNTATARALPDVRSSTAVPVIGVVRPGAVAVTAATRSRKVGVIATAGTVESDAYPAAIREADESVSVIQRACPDLVPLVESGQLDGDVAEATVRDCLLPLLDAQPQIDSLLLGCTHYPLLRPVIERIAGPAVSVVDSAFTAALAVEDLLDALGIRAENPQPATNRIVTTGDVDAFTTVAHRVFRAELPRVESLEPMAASDLP